MSITKRIQRTAVVQEPRVDHEGITEVGDEHVPVPKVVSALLRRCARRSQQPTRSSTRKYIQTGPFPMSVKYGSGMNPLGMRDRNAVFPTST